MLGWVVKTGIDYSIPVNYIIGMANKYTKMILDIDRMKSLYLSGMTQVEVAEEMGTTQRVVFSRLKAAGVKCRVAFKRNQNGAYNSSWKGSSATYAAFHYRLYSLKGRPKKCEVCGTTDETKTYDWANLTKRYDDPNDYKRMCRSCHWKYDRKHLNLKGGKIDAR